MSTTAKFKSQLREQRIARGWSQQETANRSGIARASVSAIEMGRLIPSAAAALALAAAFGCRVEDLFQLQTSLATASEWAWTPALQPTRYWQAEVSGRRLLYPSEETCLGAISHDGISLDRELRPRAESIPATLVIATCDPAAGLLAAELARQSGIRLLPLVRSSRQALQLLQQGLIHVAGIHLDHGDGAGNAIAVRSELGTGYQLVRVAHWEEGVVTASDRQFRSLRAVAKTKMRWIGREPGSGARQCMDQLLGSKFIPQRTARDHRGVAEAIRSGWAEAGVCLRLTGEESRLGFFPIREEAYDLCYSADLSHEPRLVALLQAIRSVTYRQLLEDLPGYSSRATGEVQNIN